MRFSVGMLVASLETKNTFDFRKFRGFFQPPIKMPLQLQLELSARFVFRPRRREESSGTFHFFLGHISTGCGGMVHDFRSILPRRSLLCRPKLWLLGKNSRPHTFFAQRKAKFCHYMYTQPNVLK